MFLYHEVGIVIIIAAIIDIDFQSCMMQASTEMWNIRYGNDADNDDGDGENDNGRS